MRGGKVVVHRFTDGRIQVFYKDRLLTCTAFATHAVPDPAEDEKTLDARIDAIVASRRTSAHTAVTTADGMTG
jgi:hypothetical protein